MSRFGALLRGWRRRALITLAIVGLGVTAAFVRVGSGSAPALPTAEVTKGEFVDALEIRGEIRPLKSIVLAAPMQSGELQILKLAKNGSLVKPGDIVVQFDSTTLRRTKQEKESELKQSDAEIEQASAQARITKEQNATELMRSKYNIERAKLDVDRGDTVSRIDQEKAKLALADTQQKLKELEAKIKSDTVAMEAELSNKRRKREKALFDLQRADRGLQNLELKAPAGGMVNILPNYRAGSLPWGGGEVEFRQGDRAWAGASILELPDLSSVHLEARLDESDRGRLSVGQDASIRIEAVPGKEFKARIERISVLARIATDRVPDVVLVPSESVFQRDGHTIVYKLDGTEFEERRIEVARRGREQAIVKSGLTPGDRIATRRPATEMIRRTQ